MTTIRKRRMSVSPVWYRITKKIVYGLFTTTLFSGTLQRFGVSDADVALIAGWIIAIMETTGIALAEINKKSE